MTQWRFSRINIDALVFPDVDNVRCAVNEFHDCLVALRDRPTMGVSDGQDIAPIYVLEEHARRALGSVLYRWKPSKTDSEGRLVCPEVRVFFTYLYGRIIVLEPQVRSSFTYTKDEVYILVKEAIYWKRQIEKHSALGGQS